MRRVLRITPVLSAAGLGLALAAAAAAGGMFEGELDPGFYFDGKFSLDPTAGYQHINDVVLAPDGRLVIVGFRWDDAGESTLFWAALNGTSAPTICSPVTAAGGLFASASAAGFDAQGRLLLAGSASFPGDGYEGLALRYLYPACDLDESFNVDGVFRTSFSEATSFRGLGFDSQQRLVLGGQQSTISAGVIVRLTGSGLYDLNFDSDGHLELELGADHTLAGLLVQPDDRILIAGGIVHATQGGNFFAARIDPLGDLDGTFSGDGIAQVDFADGNDIANDLALDPATGKVILAGQSLSAALTTSAAVARLTGSGAIDPSFGGGDGRWSHAVADDTHLNAVELQSDGKMLVAGTFADVDSDEDMLVYRLTAAGEIDSTFGFFGAWAVGFDLGGALNDQAHASVLQGGKLLLAGWADTADERVGAVARLWISLVFADDFERGTTGGWSASSP